jgi:glucose-1-phosphate thymidylyltransferase
MKKIIGLIPAAGSAERLSPLPFSKELFPIGYYKHSLDSDVLHPKPVIHYLIEQMKLSTVKNIYVIINPNKWDIINYLKSGNYLNVNFSYLIQENSAGMPFALNLAYEWIDKNTTTIFGMPDTIFKPENSFELLLKVHQSENADLTLGLFLTTKPQKFGMVNFDENNNFLWTYDKPQETSLKFMWGIACWEYSFAMLMNDYVINNNNKIKNKEIILGDIFNFAKLQGLNIKVYPFTLGEYNDIGSLDELKTILNLINP